MSGIRLDDETQELIKNDVKGHVYKYVTFRINDEKTKICIDEMKLMSDLPDGSRTIARDHEEFRKLGEIMPQDNMRYIMYTYVDCQLNYQRCFIKWLGTDSPVKMKMIYASSEAVIREKLGIKQKLLVEDEFRFPDELLKEQEQKASK
ncbi:actophorin-like [Haliotis rufescens]|uniref:actophorin-like n=1 Tax=Haliotis rufescens TaxID=6454 RepID=UPI001EB01ECD|nr:actophorin-like [Haliotis rufescens]